jgi:plasmid stabilization system protein ParE
MEMKYSVTWTKTALNQLAEIWNDSASRNDVTAASHHLEQAVSLHPLDLGESRHTSVVRVAYRKPLGMEYEVIEDDKKVRVLRVWATS